MNFFRYFWCVLFASLFFNLNSVVIVTHGALAQESLWYQPGGSFFESLKIESLELGHKKTNSFSWDQYLGGVTHYERLKAGVKLAKLVIDFAKKGEKEIVLVGHSYGGHVIKAASQLLDDFIDDLTMYGVESEPVLDLTTTSSPDKKNIEEEQKEKEELQAFFAVAKEEVQKYKEKVGIQETKAQKDYLIDSVYTLGTPNNIPDYVADMDIIGHLYNFYSKGDLVQEIVGDVLLPEPKHERAVDLSIEIKNKGWLGWGLPNHREIHAEIIAKWLLYIPNYLIQEKIGNFENFTFNATGNICFAQNKMPIYSILKDSEEVGLANHIWEWVLQHLGLSNNV
ncbi:MAG: hypothetical protein ABIA74_00580 [bacterium]